MCLIDTHISETSIETQNDEVERLQPFCLLREINNSNVCEMCVSVPQFTAIDFYYSRSNDMYVHKLPTRLDVGRNVAI